MLYLILLVVGLVFGVISVIEANLRSWAGWGVIFIAAALLLTKAG